MDKTEITREDVVEAENKLFSAQLASNVDTLDQLLHDDLVAIAPTRSPNLLIIVIVQSTKSAELEANLLVQNRFN